MPKEANEQRILGNMVRLSGVQRIWETGMIIGNIMGSNIMNIVLVLGIQSL